MKKPLRIFAVLLLILVAAFFIFRTPDTDREVMVAKYGNEASQFLDDGNGGQIHYRDEGNRNGVPIIFLHGSSSSLHTWEPLVELLADRYRTVSIDLYSHGLTGPNPAGQYDADTMIGSATKLLDELDIDKAVWVGNSMGGWLAWRAGLDKPDRVSGLILIDAAGAPAMEKGQLYLGARLANTAVGQWLLPKITPEPLVKSSIKDNYADPELVSDKLVTRYWELLRFPGNREATVLRYGIDRELDKNQQLGELKMPTLLLWGEKDKVIPLSHAKVFQAAIPGSILITYPNAGHLPMEETPQQVARDIGQWIEGITKVAP